MFAATGAVCACPVECELNGGAQRGTSVRLFLVRMLPSRAALRFTERLDAVVGGVWCQVGCGMFGMFLSFQCCRVFRSVLRMVRSFLMQATSAFFFSFPLASSL